MVKLDEKKADAKIKRWQGIAEAAAKQSKRSLIPKIMPVISLREAFTRSQKMQVRLIPYERAEGMEKTREILKGIRPGDEVAVFIGPEGGFEETEIEEAMKAQIKPVTLGKRILRTETAGVTVLAFLLYQLEQ